MWERVAADIRAAGGRVLMDARVTSIRHSGGRVSRVASVGPGGALEVHEADHFILSMPLRETVLALDPAPPGAVLEAARNLRYRDFLTVALVVEGDNPFPDNWIYIHEPGVKLGRIQNFKNWSEAMIGRPGTTCLGLEYFCFAGDGLWSMPDSELVELGKRELQALGLVETGRVTSGSVVRVEKAYPVYDPGYQANVATIREALGGLANLDVVGRNGMHKYNNQDHSMMTAMLAVRNLGGGQFDLWKVNSDAEYHEGAAPDDNGGRRVPVRTAQGG
jgi:protoporphyrinogen oxidase